MLSNLGIVGYDVLEKEYAGIEKRLTDQQAFAPSDSKAITFGILESAVQRLFLRIKEYEDITGLSSVAPTTFASFNSFA